MAKAITIALSYEELRRARLRSQLLAPGSQSASAAAVVQRLCALQSQEWSSAQRAIAARTRGVAHEDIKRAREIDRSFVLTWSLRGTLHLVPSDDVRWQVELCGPGAIRRTRRRYQQLGLSESIREQALSEIQDILKREGALVRSELATALAERGIPVAGQAIHHLVRFAALRGLICLGPEIDGDLTYVLLADWLPLGTGLLRPNDQARELAWRYLAACAPATRLDFARWSGLSARQVKAAWAAVADDCFTVSIPGGDALMLYEQVIYLKPESEQRAARFLPRYDNYLLGYASRAFMVADKYAKRVHPGGGLIRACVLVDGEARANWKLEKRGKRQRILLEPFEELDAEQVALLAAEAEALGQFLNADLELRVGA